jgi:hypothetical protein
VGFIVVDGTGENGTIGVVDLVLKGVADDDATLRSGLSAVTAATTAGLFVFTLRDKRGWGRIGASLLEMAMEARIIVNFLKQ